MRSIILALFVIGFVFVYTELETTNKNNIATPLIQQKLITQKKKNVVTNQVAYAHDTYLMAIGTPKGELTLWHKEFEHNKFNLQKDGNKIINLTFSQDENWLLSTDNKGKVQLWNMNSLHLVRTFKYLKQQGYLDTFSEFIEVNTFSEDLIFMDKDDKYLYFNYETERLSNKPNIPIATY